MYLFFLNFPFLKKKLTSAHRFQSCKVEAKENDYLAPRLNGRQKNEDCAIDLAFPHLTKLKYRKGQESFAKNATMLMDH